MTADAITESGHADANGIRIRYRIDGNHVLITSK